MRYSVLAIALGLTLSSCACAPAVSQPPASILPLRTLRIYETGVGYFERAGSLDGSHTSLPVPASHLDDALETLVVLSASARLRESEQDHASADQIKNELAELDKDIDRLREHMKALSGEHAGAAQANPFAARILAGEDKLTALRAKQAKLQADAKAKHEAALGALAKLGS